MRLIYSANPSGTESFRWAFGTHPKGYGLSPQTEPRQFRYRYHAPPGRIFINPDLDQAEARYVASRARVKNMLEIFSDPTRHLHKETGELIFGRRPEKNTPLYTVSKAATHATDYREGPWMLGLQTGIPLRDAKGIIEKIYKLRPELLAWHDEIKQIVMTQGRLSNCFGEERKFYEAVACASYLGTITDKQWKDAIAWEPQSMPPKIINRALLWLYENLDYAWFHQHGHDSFLCSVPWEKLNEVAEPVMKLLDTKITVHGEECYIPADLQAGYSWGDMMKYDGSNITRATWERLVNKRKENRRDDILDGVFGIHLIDWRDWTGEDESIQRRARPV